MLSIPVGIIGCGVDVFQEGGEQLLVPKQQTAISGLADHPLVTH